MCIRDSSLAAVLAGKIETADRKTVCLLSGGNIDVSFIHRVIAVSYTHLDVYKRQGL